jgi:hypothetical protein
MLRTSGGRHKDSPIWNFFKYDAAVDKSTCLISVSSDSEAGMRSCDKQLAGKNPTNLKVHLKTFHKKHYEEFERLNCAKQQQGETSKSLSCKPPASVHSAVNRTQQVIEQFSRRAKTVAEIKHHNDLLVTMFVKTGVTTRLMDHPAFRALFSGFQLPGE